MKRMVFYPHMHVSVERLNKLLDGANTQDFLFASSLQGAMPNPWEKNTLMILTDVEPDTGGLDSTVCDELKLVDAKTHDPSYENTLDMYVKPGIAFTSDTIFTIGEVAPSGNQNQGVDVRFPYPLTNVPSVSGELGGSADKVVRIDAICVKYDVQDNLPETLTFLDQNNNLYQEIRNAQREDSYEIVIINGALSPDPTLVPPEYPTNIPEGYYLLAYVHLRYGTRYIDSSDTGVPAHGFIEDARQGHAFYNKQVTNERVNEDDLTAYGATDTFYTAYNFLRSSVVVYLNGIRLAKNSGTVTYTLVENNQIVLSTPKGVNDSLVASYTRKLH